MTDEAERTKRPAELTSAELTSGDHVPRLPRGRGLRLSGPQLVRIAGTVCLLVFLVLMQRPCANAVSTFVTGFGDAGGRGSAATVMPRPGTVDVPAGSAAEGDAAGSAASTGAGSAGSAAPSLDPSLDSYEHLRPGMTDEEVKAVIDRARHKAAGERVAP
jgi:hypothetical protein